MSALIKDEGRGKSGDYVQLLLSIRSKTSEGIKKEPIAEEAKTSISEIPSFKKTTHIERKEEPKWIID